MIGRIDRFNKFIQRVDNLGMADIQNEMIENMKTVYTVCITSAIRNKCFDKFNVRDNKERHKAKLMREITLHVLAENIIKKYITMEEIEKYLFTIIGEAICDVRVELEKIINL
jgi:hypothetical protein